MYTIFRRKGEQIADRFPVGFSDSCIVLISSSNQKWVPTITTAARYRDDWGGRERSRPIFLYNDRKRKHDFGQTNRNSAKYHVKIIKIPNTSKTICYYKKFKNNCTLYKRFMQIDLIFYDIFIFRPRSYCNVRYNKRSEISNVISTLLVFIRTYNRYE